MGAYDRGVTIAKLVLIPNCVQNYVILLCVTVILLFHFGGKKYHGMKKFSRLPPHWDNPTFFSSNSTFFWDNPIHFIDNPTHFIDICIVNLDFCIVNFVFDCL